VTRVERIRAALEAAFAPSRLEVEDDSHRHAGHAGARDGRGHFNVLIVSPVFAGKAPLARHRAVYAALGDMMPPTALAGLFAAKITGVDNYVKVLKRCMVPMAVMLVYGMVFIYFSKTIAGWF